jgi:TAG lipase / steryl ester hydrolase / phospholipase A2 / LPA acyltransferase
MISGLRQNRWLSLAMNISQNTLREVLKTQQSLSLHYTRNMPRLNLLLTSAHSLINQEYTGDVNILPSFRFYDVRKVLTKLSDSELMELMREGELAAWPHIETVRTTTLISRVLDDILNEYHKMEVEAVKKVRSRHPGVKRQSNTA